MELLFTGIRYGKEGAITGAFYMMAYLLVFIPCIAIITVFSMCYIWRFLHRLRYKIGAVFLFLLYLALLVTVPHMKNDLMCDYIKAKIQKQLAHQREIQKLIVREIPKGTNVDEVKTWLQRENVAFVYLEDTHEIVARIPKKRLLHSDTVLVEFPMFIQFDFDSDSNLKTSLVTTKHWPETYKKMKSRFKERNTSCEQTGTKGIQIRAEQEQGALRQRH